MKGKCGNVHNEDGMDQSKWAIPRFRGHVITKELGKFQRPKLKLHAVWAGNVGMFLFLVDPRQSSDSSLVAEAASIVLEKVKERLGARMPHHLVCLTDNTVRENKNNVIWGWLNQLTARGKFRTATLAHARVGHTHGPLGILSLCPNMFCLVGL